MFDSDSPSGAPRSWQRNPRAPFLKRLTVLPERLQPDAYPFNLPILEMGRLELTFDRPVTFFIGDNGTGKSTLLEAIAAHCGSSISPAATAITRSKMGRSPCRSSRPYGYLGCRR
jgi:hypothetical protein